MLVWHVIRCAYELFLAQVCCQNKLRLPNKQIIKYQQMFMLEWYRIEQNRSSSFRPILERKQH